MVDGLCHVLRRTKVAAWQASGLVHAVVLTACRAWVTDQKLLTLELNGATLFNDETKQKPKKKRLTCEEELD